MTTRARSVVAQAPTGRVCWLGAAAPVGVLLATIGSVAHGSQLPTPPPLVPPPLWQVNEYGRGTPAIDGDDVYLLTRYHEVIAVDGRTGAIRWRQTTGEPGESTFGSSVVIAGAVVIAGDYNVIAFDRETGERRWHFGPRGAGYAPGTQLGPVVGDTLFTGSGSRRLYAIDTRTAAVRWFADVTTKGNIPATVFPPVVDRTIAAAGFTAFEATSAGGVLAVDPQTGRQLWQVRFPKLSDTARPTFFGGPLLVGDLVIASSGDGSIHGLARTDGTVRWTIPRLEGPLPGIITATEPDLRVLTSVGNVLVAGSLTGHVVAYDALTQKELWRYAGGFNGSTSFSMVADEQFVYVPYVSGMLVALRLATGRERAQIGDYTYGFMWSPHVTRDRVYVAGRGGLFCFSRMAFPGAA